MDPRRGGGAGDAARTASEDRKRWLPVGAAPAGGARYPAPERSQEPIGRHYDRSARSSLDWDRAENCRLDPESSQAWSRCPNDEPAVARKPGNADPGTEIAAMERREAPAFSKRECGKTEDWCAARCSIPSAFSPGGKSEYGLPGAANNTGDGARPPHTPTVVREHKARGAAFVQIDPRIHDETQRMKNLRFFVSAAPPHGLSGQARQ